MLFLFLLGKRSAQLYHGSTAISMTWHYFYFYWFYDAEENRLQVVNRIYLNFWVNRSCTHESYSTFLLLLSLVQCKLVYYRALNKNHVNKNQMMSWAAWYKLFHYLSYLFYNDPCIIFQLLSVVLNYHQETLW